MHLLKLHGAVARILLTSSLESKEKRIRWSPINFIRNPIFGLHKGLKVFAMASMLIGCLVRKRATMENLGMACSLILGLNLSLPSLIERGISSG